MAEDFDLPSLLQRSEGETLDFKATSYDPSVDHQKRDFAKDLASLANTPRDGEAHLVLGVKKLRDGSFKLTGLDRLVDDAELQGVASSLLEHCPRFSYEVLRHGSVALGLITVFSDQQYPTVPKKTLDRGFVEGRIYFRRGSKNDLASMPEQARIWKWFLSRDGPQGLRSSATDATESDHDRPEVRALLQSPVEALSLKSKVEEAGRVAATSPSDAVRLYRAIADTLRHRFPGHAERFDLLRAEALNSAGDTDRSHDLAIEIGYKELFLRAEPQPSPGVVRTLEGLHSKVGKLRQARANAIVLFGQWHEHPEVIEDLANCFDALDPSDKYAPHVAALLTEVAVADHAHQLVLDRSRFLQAAGDGGSASIPLRVSAALGDAGVSGVWQELIGQTESLRLPVSEGTYLCLRGARWCAWSGQLEKAESLYRLALNLGAEANLDLDVENALWSLTALYSFDFASEELFETNRLALSFEGTRSYVLLNSRTTQRSYQYLANGRLPDALLWTRYRLLESIRSGSLAHELEARAVLARLYSQSDESILALENAILSGDTKLAEKTALQAATWPEFLPAMVNSSAPWVRKAAILALKHLGDIAPPRVARGLVRDLLNWLLKDADDTGVAPILFEALGSVILEAAEEDIETLIPVLQRTAAREPDVYRLTDPGVTTIAARLYRFRPKLRQQAALILGEMGVGSHTGEWSQSLKSCGQDTDELTEALVNVAAREHLDLANPLADLGLVNAATRALWFSRLEFVASHPLDRRSGHAIGPRYDVPREFLREQEPMAVRQYIGKLVAIGLDNEEMVINRANALAAAGNVIDILSPEERKDLFARVLRLAEQSIEVSTADQYNERSQHALSRFRISLGSVDDVRESAGWLLARAATDSNDRCRTIAIALSWVRSENRVLQGAGASLLTLSHLDPNEVDSVELSKHVNPTVRRAALWTYGMRTNPTETTFESLTSDADRAVRIGVAQALPSVKSIDPTLYERLRALLLADRSAMVRAIATELLD